MKNYKLSIHHIGGRGGSRSFPHIEKFEGDIINVLYDADVDCINQISKQNQNHKSELHVLPYSLGDVCGSGILNINYDPYTSSLLETNHAYDSFYSFFQDHDYIMGEAAKTIEKRDIEVITMDDIFKSNDLNLPKPDFLSIDVEGGEYDIIKGAIKIMNDNVLAIFTEVAFHPFRIGQKSFSEICDFLATHGFYFASFSNVNDKIYMEEMSPFRYSIGLRGAGFHTLSEALFLRKIDTVEEEFPESTRYISLRKLAFIAIAFNQIEYGLECLKHSNLIQNENTPIEFFTTNYAQFLGELERSAEKQPQVFPQSFKSKYTFKQSKERFEWNGSTPRNKLKILLQKVPFIFYSSRSIIRIIKRIGISIVRITAGYSEFENVFIKFGLTTQASIIRDKRIFQSRHRSKIN